MRRYRIVTVACAALVMAFSVSSAAADTSSSSDGDDDKNPQTTHAKALCNVIPYLCPDSYVVNSPDAPEAIGPYSQGISTGRTLYLSGQLPTDPKTGEIPPDASIKEQTKRVLKNLEAVLRADDMELTDIVRTRVYITDISNYEAFNEAYANFFKSEPPARVTIEVAGLPANAQLEVSATAVR